MSEYFKDLKPSQLAYTLDWYRVEDDYLYDKGYYVVYAESRNKAKAKLFKLAQNNAVVFLSIEELSYLNIPIVRDKENDKYLVDGNLFTQEEYRIHILRREHAENISAILSDDNIEYCFIYKRSSYYRDDCRGYTSYKESAGVYEKEFACKECSGHLDIKPIPIDINEYNSMINEKIDYLKSRLINNTNP